MVSGECSEVVESKMWIGLCTREKIEKWDNCVDTFFFLSFCAKLTFYQLKKIISIN